MLYAPETHKNFSQFIFVADLATKKNETVLNEFGMVWNGAKTKKKKTGKQQEFKYTLSRKPEKENNNNKTRKAI